LEPLASHEMTTPDSCCGWEGWEGGSRRESLGIELGQKPGGVSSGSTQQTSNPAKCGFDWHFKSIIILARQAEIRVHTKIHGSWQSGQGFEFHSDRRKIAAEITYVLT
jgi:hypothetical protein